MDKIIAFLKKSIQKLNEYGVPLPLIRINGYPTFTGTMVFISFNTALLGQIGKVTNLLGAVDLTQANYLFGICLAAYLGRKLQSNGSTKSLDMEAKGGKEEPK
jgi:uncharacterized membrane protein YfcA